MTLLTYNILLYNSRLTSIDAGSIKLMINDVVVYDGSYPNVYPYTTVTERIPGYDYILEFLSPEPFENEQQVTIVVDAQDLNDPPNVMPQHVYSFTITAQSSDNEESELEPINTSADVQYSL